MRYFIISLGCPKNTVDAQGIGLLLDQAGHLPAEDPDEADLILVNTCGFIDAARDESKQVLQELIQQKKPGQRIIAAGCWAQRAGETLAQEIDGLNGILGTRRWAEIVPMIRQTELGQTLTMVGNPSSSQRRDIPRVAIQGASAYLKIADGCSARCAYCAIPLIKGPLNSRPVEDILEDARRLAAQGVQEIILIAQDTTAYGQDRGEKDALPMLLEALVEAVPKVPWIRLMYTYPQHISQRLIQCMAKSPHICNYLDLPLQHAHPATLKRMRRPSDMGRVRRLIADLRDAMPDIAIRTSFIVGFPGETEAEFDALEQFMQEICFDKVGVFIYSPEQGTAAFDMPNQMGEKAKKARYDRLMQVQQALSWERNQAQIGRTLNVLIEGVGEAETENPDEAPVPVSIGRSYRDAPEIDGMVILEAELEPGRMASAQIVDAMAYDLIGIV